MRCYLESGAPGDRRFVSAGIATTESSTLPDTPTTENLRDPIMLITPTSASTNSTHGRCDVHYGAVGPAETPVYYGKHWLCGCNGAEPLL